jgi:multiple sugar transport system ATP-binding protein
MSYVELKDVIKVYPGKKEDKKVVKEFNLSAEKGEFIVFVGPSGCGKSTTLRMIAGLEEISGGELRFEGELMNDVSPKDRDIAMVFQNYALYPHMTVFDNIAFTLKLKKTPRNVIDDKVKETARMLGLEQLLDRKPKDLSGGQRQRVALGRAAVRSPKVFLMDEPLSNLDAKLRGQMRTEIIKLHKNSGATTIYVTHDQTEAMTMADRIVVLKDGYIQQLDTPKNIYDKPTNVFVAGFIGAPSMNFIKGNYSKGQFVFQNKWIKLKDYQVKLLDEHGYEDKEIIMGVRPEHISSSNLVIEAFSEAKFEIEIEIAELFGPQYHIHTSIGEQPLVYVDKANKTLFGGEKEVIAFELTKVHFFDGQTQEAIR